MFLDGYIYGNLKLRGIKMDVRQIRTALKPLIQKARKENKVFVHNKVRDKNGNPKPLTPEELEKELDNGRCVYPHEEWKLYNRDISPKSLKLILMADEGTRDKIIVLLEEERERKKKNES